MTGLRFAANRGFTKTSKGRNLLTFPSQNLYVLETPQLETQVADWSLVARRIRVPLGFAFAIFYLWIESLRAD